MSDREERQISGLKIVIDRTVCIGAGSCIELAPEVFELDDQQTVTFKSSPGEPKPEQLIEACEVCPVAALSVFDEEGEQIYP